MVLVIQRVCFPCCMIDDGCVTSLPEGGAGRRAVWNASRTYYPSTRDVRRCFPRVTQCSLRHAYQPSSWTAVGVWSVCALGRPDSQLGLSPIPMPVRSMSSGRVLAALIVKALLWTAWISSGSWAGPCGHSPPDIWLDPALKSLALARGACFLLRAPYSHLPAQAKRNNHIKNANFSIFVIGGIMDKLLNLIFFYNVKLLN